jgi:hypothetical protein
MQGGSHHHTALVALGAARNVDARQATHHRRGGCPGQHGGRGLRQQATACRQRGSPTAMASHSLMAHAQEPGGSDVQQEPSDALLRSHCHDLGPVAAAPIMPPQDPLPCTQGHQPVMAEGDPMRRAAQGREDVLCRGTGRLGRDDPGLLPQWGEETLEGPGVPQGRRGPGTLETVLRLGAVESGEICAAQHPGERCDRQEQVAALGGYPAGRIWGHRPTGHHTVHMEVVVQGVAPGMEAHRDAQCAPKPLGITSKGLPCR